jgi:hypothetical protein
MFTESFRKFVDDPLRFDMALNVGIKIFHDIYNKG